MTAIRLKPIEEQVVVLMGASSGIGRETALRFARKGAKVVVSARGEEGLNSSVEEVRGEGGEATMTIADTSEFDQVKAVADRAVEQYGRLDTWVHLAAVGALRDLRADDPPGVQEGHRCESDGTGLRSDGRITPPQARGSWGVDSHLLGRSQALLPVP
jgi:NAD(P)-dependent dehydrogenase (short-subunit alcohol dehydrogenase family)